MNNDSRGFYFEEDVKGIKTGYFWLGTAFGVGAVLILEFMGYMWYVSQAGINSWFHP